MKRLSLYEVSSQFMRSYLHQATCNSTDEASNVVFQRVRPPSQLMRSYLILCGLQRLMSIDEASNSTHATSNSIYEASNSTHLNLWGIQRLMSVDEASNVSFQRTRHPTQLMRRPTQLISTYEASNSTYEASNSTYMRHPMSYVNWWGIQCLISTYEASNSTYAAYVEMDAISYNILQYLTMSYNVLCQLTAR